jgi:ATP-dependent Clp protease adaptor protein ClpS
MAKELDLMLSDELNEVVLEEEKDLTGLQLSQLLVYNDDFNTFDWVIQCFMEVCNHTFEQSEQLSLIVHYKGKAIVKTGDFEILKPMKDALLERGLSAVIEVAVKE